MKDADGNTEVKRRPVPVTSDLVEPTAPLSDSEDRSWGSVSITGSTGAEETAGVAPTDSAEQELCWSYLQEPVGEQSPQ